jgi:hypothetical protein
LAHEKSFDGFTIPSQAKATVIIILSKDTFNFYFVKMGDCLSIPEDAVIVTGTGDVTTDFGLAALRVAAHMGQQYLQQQQQLMLEQQMQQQQQQLAQYHAPQLVCPRPELTCPAYQVNAAGAPAEAAAVVFAAEAVAAPVELKTTAETFTIPNSTGPTVTIHRHITHNADGSKTVRETKIVSGASLRPEQIGVHQQVAEEVSV